MLELQLTYSANNMLELQLSHNPGSHRENVEVEIKALRALIGQPNIVQFIDAFQDPDLFFIVMEFVSSPLNPICGV